MYPPRTSALLGLAALIAVVSPSLASPLPRDAAPIDGAIPAQRLSDADLALNDPRLDLAPESAAATAQAQLLGTRFERRDNGAGQHLDFGDATAGGSMHDVLRSFVNVRRGNAASAAANQPRARNRPRDDLAEFDFGLTSNEWVRESAQALMGSVLNLNVNERGQASFSVLGFGDFSVIVSADRSEIALTSGGDAIVTTQRAGHGAHPGGGVYSARYGNGPWDFDTRGGAGAAGTPGESPLRKAIELALEIASHPLSFIVYALIAAYAVIWGILSARPKKPLRGSAHRHVSPSVSMTHRVHAAVAPPAPQRQRKRLRMRLRVRKYR